MTAQPGILPSQSPYHFHVEYSIDDFSDIDELKRVVRSEQASAELRTRQVLFGFSDTLWNAMSSDRVPSSYRKFNEICGRLTSAPATQGDLWIWIHGDSHPMNLDAALSLNRTVQRLGARRNLDLLGYMRHENRDFTGFIDGTENPEGDDAIDAALIPGGNGSSFALTQKWVHNLPKFKTLATAAQERVIGRTKRDSIELQGDAMPEDSHVSRTDAVVEGIKQKILRRSVPHGDIDNRGLHFVSFACDLMRIQIQLERMFGATDDRIQDRLIEYSTPVTGSYQLVCTVC